MKSVLVFLFLTLIAVVSAQNQGAETCVDAVAFCGSSFFLPPTSGVAETGPNYGCLAIQPAPSWFVFQIGSGNNLTIQFSNTLNADIDFAIWGPFSSISCPQLDNGTIAPLVCSFSDSASEVAFLPEVAPGQLYIMVVTNHDRANTQILAFVNFTTTNGNLDCAIVPGSPSSTFSPTPSITPTRSLSSSQSVSATRSPAQSPSSSRTPTSSTSFSPSQTAAQSVSRSSSATRTPSRSASASPTISGTPRRSRSSSPSTSPTRSDSRTPTVTRTPSVTSRRSRSPTPSTSPTRSETQTPRASRSNTRTPTPSPIPRTTGLRSSTPSISLSPVPRTTGLRTTGVVIRTTGARTTGVINRTTGVINRTTGVILARTTGVRARTTGVRASDTPSTSEIILPSSSAFTVFPVLSSLFVAIAFSFTILIA